MRSPTVDSEPFFDSSSLKIFRVSSKGLKSLAVNRKALMSLKKHTYSTSLVHLSPNVFNILKKYN